MIVDAHAHVIVPEICRDVAPGESWRPRVYRDENGSQVVELDGRPIRSAIGEFVDVEAILAAQDAAGVDRIVLSPWVPLLWYEADPAEALRRGEIQNEALAELVRSHPERIAALGTVPLQDPALAVRELERLMEEGVLSGIEVAASVRGAYLGDERFESFWEAAERTGALVFIHPTTRGFDAEAFREYYLWNTVGNPLETTVTAAHMVMAGVMERHPRLHVLLAHGGGAVLALRGRLRHAHGFQPQARSRLSESPESRCAASTTTRSHTITSCCGRWWSSPARNGSCSDPIIRSTWARGGRPTACAPPAWGRTRKRRSSPATQRVCWESRERR
jgi:aminocarboxymuconate-semialdehyde decarboxylase